MSLGKRFSCPSWRALKSIVRTSSTQVDRGGAEDLVEREISTLFVTVAFHPNGAYLGCGALPVTVASEGL